MIIVVNLDPHQGQQGTAHVPQRLVGCEPGTAFDVRDLPSDRRLTWSNENYVCLDPAHQPAHVLRVEGVR